MIDIRKAADDAEVIIRGYAMNRCDEGIRILNLNNGNGAAVLKTDGTLIETNMDDIEVGIVRDYMLSALKYMEE